jgi:hypothetical protein
VDAAQRLGDQWGFAIERQAAGIVASLDGGNNGS